MSWNWRLRKSWGPVSAQDLRIRQGIVKVWSVNYEFIAFGFKYGINGTHVDKAQYMRSRSWQVVTKEDLRLNRCTKFQHTICKESLNYEWLSFIGLNIELTLKVLNFWKFTSYCSLKPLWSGMGEVVPARTLPTLHTPSPPTVHQLSWLALQDLSI